MQRSLRLKRELQFISTEPPPGISCWQNGGQMDDLRAQIVGGVNTPFEGGVFSLEIKIPERYPFEPPKMRFLTPIYHPNIDTAGRICLDALKLPPKGAWKPSLNISTVLTSIQLLMAEPNPDDPLMADIVVDDAEDFVSVDDLCKGAEVSYKREAVCPAEEAEKSKKPSL
ncbi:ubiquitin-conjugating enzyme E2 T isoform X4 [Lepisosteus oculatus]|uniref:ubiquitin-conjugating enzyme E2 T isoform X4 n=1 Tax=Lepisosteus oculatus TaxID=7918 RepID=UPI00073FED58|nr:PREDICTED: ubiquitin-conjugating enzyme E2 T isoform X3 [Lepisosteus oculatus]